MMHIFVLFALLYIPGPVFTAWNMVNLICNEKHTEKFELIAFTVGIIYGSILYEMWGSTPWDEAIRYGLHDPFSEAHMFTLGAFLAIGLFSYAFLRSKKERARPLATVVSMAGIYIGILVNVAVLVHLYGSANAEQPFQKYMFKDVLLMMLLPFNYLLLSIKLLIQTTWEQHKRLKKRRIYVEGKAAWTEEPKWEPYKNSFLNSCNQKLRNHGNWALYGLLLVFPMVCLIILVLFLLGEEPDSIICVFTETSDWTFSTKISPHW